ncbi:MAG: signal peptidase I [Sandaracinaceae bacterium]
MERPIPPPSADRAEGESRWDQTVANVKTIGGALILALIIRIVLFEAFEIEGPSMEPTLLHGDRVVVAKFLYGLFPPLNSRWPVLGTVPVLAGDEALVTWGMPSAGHVVIVHSPMDNQDIVKRVIGVEGDRIRMQAGEVFRNGESLFVEVHGACDTQETTHMDEGCEVVEEHIGDRSWFVTRNRHNQDSFSERIVPDDHIFVLGDHRHHSNDSRAIGPIPAERVKGRALSIYWSRSKAGSVRWDRMFGSVR